MYLYAVCNSTHHAYERLDSLIAEGEVSLGEVAAVKPLPRKSPYSKEPTRIGIYLKEASDA